MISQFINKVVCIYMVKNICNDIFLEGTSALKRETLIQKMNFYLSLIFSSFLRFDITHCFLRPLDPFITIMPSNIIPTRTSRAWTTSKFHLSMVHPKPNYVPPSASPSILSTGRLLFSLILPHVQKLNSFISCTF